MITSAGSNLVIDTSHHPTVWGLDPTQLVDRFWASRGVQVVRQGERSEIVEGAELFLLTDPRTMCIFKLGELIELLSWEKPDVLFVRLHCNRELGYREFVVSDDNNQFKRFQRSYGGSDSRLARVALTPERQIAEFWQSAPDPLSGWRMLRKRIHRSYRATRSMNGSVYDRTQDHEVSQFVRDLVRIWKHPNSTIPRAQKGSGRVWQDLDTTGQEGQAKCIGSVWLGAGIKLDDDATVVGPTVIWDAPECRPEIANLEWEELEPTEVFDRPVRVKKQTSFHRVTKRAFDFLFALTVILLTLPLYPFIMLAIFIEDGRPFFFAHKRETKGGEEFPCLKFRSMFNNAEEIKARLQAENEADGPQFFMENDPRVTRIGRLLRKTYLDELPQFFNVLLGQMSVVGPRPSPRKENQFCPPWREARLSVRPGVTGLWQVKRTRNLGEDFQEWIKYDLEYVEKASWKLDIYIIWKTFVMILRGVTKL